MSEQALERVPDHKPSLRAARRVMLELRDQGALPLFDAEIRITADPSNKALLYRAKARAIEDLGGEPKEAHECYVTAATLDAANATVLESLAHVELEARAHGVVVAQGHAGMSRQHESAGGHHFVVDG